MKRLDQIGSDWIGLKRLDRIENIGSYEKDWMGFNGLDTIEKIGCD